MVSKRTGRSRVLRFLLAAGGILGLVGIGVAGAFYLTILRDLPDLDSIEDYRPPLASVVTDRGGERIGEFFVERRELVRLADVPHHVVRAFLAAEDSGFFEHTGIDLKSIVRAAWANFRAGGKVQGASTITQQTVKGLLLSPEQTYSRKLREIVLARDLERRFTKQEILYLYLNQIYFGQGAYGIQEAARSYFGKTVDELTVSEAALLAGLPKAPSKFSPSRNPKRAEQRRVYVLSRMLEENYIDAETHERALAEPPELSNQAWRESYAAAAYFTEEVRRTLFDQLGGDTVLEGGLRIETTLDLEHQKVAVGAVQHGLEDLDLRQGYRGPLRQIAPEQLEAEIADLAITNKLVPEQADGDESALPPTLEARLAEGALEGVVTAVSRAEQRATVQFAPEMKAQVDLADVTWARKPNPDLLTSPIKQIDSIFRVGDVSRFGRAGDAKDGSIRVTLAQKPLVQGGLFSLDVATGEVLAMVGGYDFAESQFNRVTQARRQPGSAFKPLVYGAALAQRSEDGRRYTPASIIHDRPKVYRDHKTGLVWKPKNYGREFYGPITLRLALAKSVNTAAVHLCDEVGVGNVIRYARRLGIESPLDPSLGLALGTSGVSLLELTRSYAVFAAQGRQVSPRFIRRVTDRDGNVLLENLSFGEAAPEQEGVDETPDVASGPDDLEQAPALPEDPGAVQLIPSEDAYLVTDMLRAVVNEGTGKRAAKLGRPLAGKTGTTNDQADAWFVGFSPEIATGVWVGYDEVQFLGAGETGSRAAAPIWVDYMGQVLADVPKRAFSLPPAIVFARIDRATGLLANEQSQETVFQPFVTGTEPTETAATRRTNSEAMRNLREDSLESENALQLMRNDGF